MRFHWIDIKVFTSLLTPDISFYFACCCSPVTRITKRKNCIAKECDFKSSQWAERSIPSCIWFSAGDCEVLFVWIDSSIQWMERDRLEEIKELSFSLTLSSVLTLMSIPYLFLHVLHGPWIFFVPSLFPNVYIADERDILFLHHRHLISQDIQRNSETEWMGFHSKRKKPSSLAFSYFLSLSFSLSRLFPVPQEGIEANQRTETTEEVKERKREKEKTRESKRRKSRKMLRERGGSLSLDPAWMDRWGYKREFVCNHEQMMRKKERKQWETKR